jgi:hypothetical protein
MAASVAVGALTVGGVVAGTSATTRALSSDTMIGADSRVGTATVELGRGGGSVALGYKDLKPGDRRVVDLTIQGLERQHARPRRTGCGHGPGERWLHRPRRLHHQHHDGRSRQGQEQRPAPRTTRRLGTTQPRSLTRTAPRSPNSLTSEASSTAPVMLPAECEQAGMRLDGFEDVLVLGPDQHTWKSLDERGQGAGPFLVMDADGDDEIVGSKHADCIVGGGGRDRLAGGAGDDVLISGTEVRSARWWARERLVARGIWRGRSARWRRATTTAEPSSAGSAPQATPAAQADPPSDGTATPSDPSGAGEDLRPLHPARQ